MYSDSILSSNPATSITTLSAEQEAQRQGRVTAWNQNGPSLIGRMGSGTGINTGVKRGKGRGQIGGGSYADMMVD